MNGIYSTHMCYYICFDLLGLNFDRFWAICEVPVFVSQGGTGAVNVMCPKLVSEIFLESNLTGAHNSVDNKHGKIWCQFVNDEFITDYYETR